MAGITCGMPEEDEEIYDCYNRTIDTLLSKKFKIDFRKQLDQKVDSFLKHTTVKELRERYGYF